MNLQIAYIGLTLLMTIICVLLGAYAIRKTFPDKAKRNKKYLLLIAALIGWLLYIGILSKSGFLHDLSFPPKFALFLVIPSFILTGIFLYQNRNQNWIKSIPPHWLIFYQTFRVLVESLFVFSVAAGILHQNVTVEGYNYDMVFAFTAPIIGFLLFQNLKKYKVVVLIWNYLGLTVIAFIIFLFMSTIYKPELFGPETLPFPIEFTSFPYTYVAGFLMPSAVFIHLLSIIQLNRS